MKKLYLLIILNICAFLGISLVSCTDEPMQDETSASLDETTSIPEETTDGRDYGTLSIDDVFAWVGYPDNYVIPIFSNSECGEALAEQGPHDYPEQPTAERDGYAFYVCRVCGEIEIVNEDGLPVVPVE